MKRIICLVCFCFSLLLISSCLVKKNKREVVQGGEGRIYSTPDFEDASFDDQRYRRIVIVGTNDIFGNVVSREQEPRVGGFPVMARYFEILRKKYPGQTLFVDAGNRNLRREGTSPVNDELIVRRFFDSMKYDALTIGLYDFDLNLKFAKTKSSLQESISFHKAPFVVSNMIDLRTFRPIKWKNASPYIIKKVNGVKVAVMGGLFSSAWTLIPKENLNGLYFQNLSESIIKYSRQARRRGAKVVIALVHSRSWCGVELMKKYNVDQYSVNFDPRGEDFCNKEGDLFRLLDDMPERTIDAVVSGGSSSKIANFYNDIPVIQSFSDGHFLGRIELFYDTKKKKVDHDMTRIHQPTKLCHQFFSSTLDCHDRGQKKTGEKLISASFLGEKILPSTPLKSMVKRYGAKVENRLKSEVIDLHPELIEKLLNPSMIGHLVSLSIKRETDAKIGFAVNLPGPTLLQRKGNSISYRDLYAILPGRAALMKVAIRGSELKMLVEMATAEKGIPRDHFAGLKIVLHNDILKSRDLNEDGKEESWEKNRVKSVQLSSGDQIEDDQTYTLGTHHNFFDEKTKKYDFIFSRIEKKRKKFFDDKTDRKALLNLLKSLPQDQKSLGEELETGAGWRITI